ncbi:ABC transporter [Rhizoctonia solani]|uniref:ABC transporter n=1 Tax=Rhizoctonia solani TaxID=456999 RepID=A0A8H8NPW1_9AGAM|nr:ABC transporter [Rhizoctonia solani]QRW17704.1 ABC transporter [Rhizoctonia solani]
MFIRRSETALLAFAGLTAARASAPSYNNTAFSLFKQTGGHIKNTRSLSTPGFSPNPFTDLTLPPHRCPPCFNCLLPAFTCGQFGECSSFDGQCKCPPGYSGIDCLTPQCGSLADGKERHPRPNGEQCQCSEGWTGINCNVCETDAACANFPLRGGPDGEFLTRTVDHDADVPVANMTCYKGGVTVEENFQMCDVTNRKILDMLPDRPPQVTFSCNNEDSTCAFQFWIGQVESFYCALDQCENSLKVGYDSNTTTYHCDKIKCQCVTGRMLCGEEGSIDIGDFLTEEIKGPADFSCKTGQGCKFQEPAMNNLINDVFGDTHITLNCKGGECLHYTQVPGYVRPPPPDNTRFLALSGSAAGLILLIASSLFWYIGRTQKTKGLRAIQLPSDENAKLMADHVPASLYFSDVSYTLDGRQILSDIVGGAQPGQVLAIMGASGAGKSTLLDLLARKQKRGAVGGQILVNGNIVTDDVFRGLVGFVDQEDTLMGTLTVYETVLYSALLRLPREMSLAAKKYRTLETIHELGLDAIKDMRVGESGRRSISGGEKRRVSIACELVTSPSILFLDEPTSGLDAYNAFNVVESLVSLARDYKRTVIFTIHQPRSNIVSMFDQLILLAQGRVVYSGEYAKCQSYFEQIGHSCPPGFNIADYLSELLSLSTTQKPAGYRSSAQLSLSESSADEESGLVQGSSQGASEDSTELRTRPSTSSESAPASEHTETGNYIQRKSSQLFEAFSSSPRAETPVMLPPKLAALVQSYSDSDVAGGILAEIIRLRETGGAVLPESGGRNLYRDPALLAAHYLSSVGVALICALFYHGVTNDIPGFQNRLGLFFFALALFGFSCLSILGIFANERLLFMRERSNVPLRVVPPMVFGGLVYGLVGLVPELTTFWKFILTLVLFNLTTASVVMLISVVFSQTSVASLVGTLVMLFNLLFTGLLINRDSVPRALEWLYYVSFFHAGFEALAVNELKYLTLRQNKFGVQLDVPAATILSTFGLRAQSFWWPNISLLAIMFATFLTLSFLWLHFFVRENR